MTGEISKDACAIRLVVLFCTGLIACVVEVSSAAAGVGWLINAEMVDFVQSHNVRTWLDRKNDCCWDLRFFVEQIGSR